MKNIASCFDEQCPDENDYDVRFENEEHSDVHAILKPLEYTPVVSLGDLEGNHEAMITALFKVGYIKFSPNSDGTLTTGVTETGKGKTVVQTGDIFDRGKFPLKTLFKIQAMRKQGLNFVTVAGNHDIHNMQLASAPSVVKDDPRFYKFIEDATPYVTGFTDAETRMKKIEQLIQYNVSEEVEQYLYDAHVYLIWRYTDPNVSNNNGLINEIKARYFADNTEEPSIRDYLRKMHELFYGNGEIRGELQDYKDSLVPFHAEGPILHLHGGLDKTWAELIKNIGIKGAIRFFQSHVQTGDLDDFNYPESEYGKLTWARENKILSPEAIAVLKNLGITTIIRGHDPQANNRHTVQIIDGITIINNDVGLSRGNIAGIIINTSGQIIGFNPSNEQTIQVMAQLPTVSERINNILSQANVA